LLRIVNNSILGKLATLRVTCLILYADSDVILVKQNGGHPEAFRFSR